MDAWRTIVCGRAGGAPFSVPRRAFLAGPSSVAAAVRSRRMAQTMKPTSASKVARRGGAQAGQHRSAVAAGGRIVVVAEQQELIDRRADAVLRRFHEAELEVARGELDAEEVARDDAARGQHGEAGGVGELVALRVVAVAEADRRREPLDRRLRRR